jgi:hypothetical protein
VKEVQSLTSARQEKIYKNLTISNLVIKEMRILQINSASTLNAKVYSEIAKLDNLTVLQDIKNLVDSKIRAKESAMILHV